MRRLRLLAFTAPLFAALACKDATSPPAVTQIRAASSALVISSPWTATGVMPSSRSQHTATLLPNGKVLVAGGSYYSSAAALYDPVSNTWLPTASMATIRIAHTATLLGNGKVLVAGGANFGGTLASAELYDYTTGLWTAAASMPNVRHAHTATLLPSGKVLIASGYNVIPGCCYLGMISAAEIYDPVTGTWSTTAPIASARVSAIAALLANGKVLVAGGWDLSGAFLTSAEIYDPATGTWSFTSSMARGRGGETGTFLPNGKVMVAGGYNAPIAELYDPISGTWSFTGSMGVGRTYHTATLMAGGRVLVAGGRSASSQLITPTAEIYDAALGTWSTTASMSFARVNSTSTLLADGRVLVAGGSNEGGDLASAELFGEIVTPAPAAQTISFTSTVPSPAYVGATYVVTATATSGLPVAFSTSTPAFCSVSGSAVTFTAVGICTVTADQTGNAAFLAAPEQTQSITIVQMPQTITFSSTAPNLPLVGATYVVTATASSGLAVSLTSLTPATCTVTGTTANFVAAGPCTIAANQAGDAAYLAAAERTQSITIVQIPQSITFSSTAPTLPLVGETYVVMATASSGLAVSLTSLTPATCTVAGTTANFVAAGPCTIAANQAGNAAYLAAPEQTQSITVVTTAQATQNLIGAIASMGLPAAVANSLSAPLNNINTNNLSAACGKLNAFVNQVYAKVQNGQLTLSVASQLLQAANAIKASLACA